MATAPQRHRVPYISRPLLLTLLVALVVALAGCRDAGDNGDDPGAGSDTHTITVTGPHAAFALDVPGTWGITEVVDPAACGSVSYQIGDDRLRVDAVPTVCPEADRARTQNTQNNLIGNGNHGLYRTLADVPAPLDQKPLATPLGPAVVFTQEYYECTQKCDYWREPVAIVTLDEPLDPAYPTLVVRGPKDRLQLADLEKVLATLSG